MRTELLFSLEKCLEDWIDSQAEDMPEFTGDIVYSPNLNELMAHACSVVFDACTLTSLATREVVEEDE